MASLPTIVIPINIAYNRIKVGGKCMNSLFSNQDFGRTVLNNRELPAYVTDEYVFYRCVCFSDSFYGKTVSGSHKGNLRQAILQSYFLIRKYLIGRIVHKP